MKLGDALGVTATPTFFCRFGVHVTSKPTTDSFGRLWTTAAGRAPQAASSGNQPEGTGPRHACNHNHHNHMRRLPAAAGPARRFAARTMNCRARPPFRDWRSSRMRKRTVSHTPMEH